MEILTIIGSVLAFLLIFSVLVLVHEWGHFAAARFFGVRVDEFGLGLPPKAKKLFKRGNTEYTLNWLPLGGFVRLYGESDMQGSLANDPESFSSKPVWQRIIIAGAGVFMNFVLAFLLLVLFFSFHGRPLAVIDDANYPFSQPSYFLTTEEAARKNNVLVENTETSAKNILIQGILPGSDAERIGLTTKLAIVGVNDLTPKTPKELTETLGSIPVGDEIRLRIEENSTPREIRFTKTAEKIGVMLAAPLMIQGYNFDPARIITASAEELGAQTTFLLEALGSIGQSISTQGTIPEEVGGPVKIAQAVHLANLAGWDALLIISILLSVNLGVLNILPIPALDGGRILFLIIEGVTRKRIKQSWEIRIHLVGYAFLMLLMLIVTGRDILQLFTGV